ncbi:TdeIII family type II restriction endonuclease [Gilliamella sp. Pra-s65]|uniref:TdeIII family type II restriction endonuclease n=1 Tax=unclassified Gilliamella TaxID=2685620 RepID=UPI00136603AD|nr:TdeIII family type II restriction endonuclease [Gilliamella sp. Pra-s65]MWP73158.1 TdeIII family type II restriction endonuclease [Gilliamella sp. Pra-s52]
MTLTSEKKQKIAEVIIQILNSRFQNFPGNALSNRNAPFHEAFLAAFSDKIQDKITSDIPVFISLASWFHGLNTTLGQKFFESVAHILSNGYKSSFTVARGNTLTITDNQSYKISDIIAKLNRKEKKPDVAYENSLLIFDKKDLSKSIDAWDFTVDVFIENQYKITCIELKAVKPNAGEIRGEKTKILQAKAALFRKYPNKTIEFFIGFPFDPTNNAVSPTSFDKKRFMSSIINMNNYFSSKEVLLSSELWDFLSGKKGTMEEILSIIRDIATPDFLNNLEFLKNKSNKSDSLQEYLDLLNKWHLKSEIELLNCDENLLTKIKSNEQSIRIYNQPIFNTKAEYNRSRYEHLSKLISK